MSDASTHKSVCRRKCLHRYLLLYLALHLEVELPETPRLYHLKKWQVYIIIHIVSARMVMENTSKVFFLYGIFPPINSCNEVCMNIFICIGTSNVCVKWKRELVIRVFGIQCKDIKWYIITLINERKKLAVEAKSLSALYIVACLPAKSSWIIISCFRCLASRH